MLPIENQEHFQNKFIYLIAMPKNFRKDLKCLLVVKTNGYYASFVVFIPMLTIFLTGNIVGLCIPLAQNNNKMLVTAFFVKREARYIHEFGTRNINKKL
jgi:hypothetical protein